ncbi:MAG: UDP-N-acetylmuramoyl-L-alanyl-D-glutamate--2,6-diaminopimelate ligase [Flavobacteriales bacterium]|nr:UDP-N-acetylmuramoyl-L-alanyl-D-glutamate--2,6-diaminopimelate ligase [Flavobacteriales bacterium]|tara:strand:- start:6035 stop:7480 length:1446 start_codon:yes stop_codon:yes gene_type:complete
MKKLKDILYNVNVTEIFGSTNRDVFNISFDSRKIIKGGVFVAIKGQKFNGHDYILFAIKQGVKIIIFEEKIQNYVPGITYVKVQDSSKSLSVIASNFYDNPSSKLKLIGVTGTNGKTTIVNILYQLFTMLGAKVGMLSTIENKILDRTFPAKYTTPDALEINYLLSKMLKEKCEYCFMEVSSHAISQSRIFGLKFSAGIFTNITHDHLDYHKSFDNYINVKKRFFTSLSKTSFALINKDDNNSLKMVENCNAKVITYSLKSVSDFKCKVVENQFNGMLLNISKVDVWVKLSGRFNAYNILSAYAIAKQFNFLKEDILTNLSIINSPEGRFQSLVFDSVTGIVDYAHTDDALKNILTTINDIRVDQQLITVLGCGGDRDKLKRPIMTKTAVNLSSLVILTSDNPRTEDPNEIIKDMTSGLNTQQKKKTLIIIDRSQAIKTACKIIKKNGIILIAGKGHEKYQEIDNERYEFDDYIELKKAMN